MKSNIITVLILLFSLCSMAQTLTFEKTEEGAWIREDGEKVLFYQGKTKSKEGKFPRANYIHPLYGIDGFELTEDFPEDHLHHRGIFWTWHQVLIGEKRIGDAWICEDFIWDVQKIEPGKKVKDKLEFNIQTFWKSPLWKDIDGSHKAFMDERTKVTVHRKSNNYRVIDFEISLLALEPDLKLGGSDDKKGYSGFSIRMKMPKDIKFTSEAGEVAPTTEAISAGSWIDVSGSLAADGGNGGVVMMCHPENPAFPDPWILRKKGSMQNPAWPGRVPVLISDKKPTILKYRLVVYNKKLSEGDIDALSKSYN